MCSAVEAAGAADLVILTTPDGAIKDVCDALVDSRAFRPGTLVAHCSGLLTSEVLQAARTRGACRLASIHPLQSFPSLEAALEHLPGSFGFYEGDAEAVGPIRALGEAVGMTCVAIDPGAKVLYHAAAVLACNYLSALMETALQLNEQAAIPRSQAWPALEKIVRATLANISNVGAPAALSGPIARGDIETVALHLRALSELGGDFESIYRDLGRVALGITEGRGELGAESLDRLRALLSPPKPQS